MDKLVFNECCYLFYVAWYLQEATSNTGSRETTKVSASYHAKSKCFKVPRYPDRIQPVRVRRVIIVKRSVLCGQLFH